MTSQAPQQSNDTSNFFHRAPIDSTYWSNYLKARPTYTPSFYASIISYHRARSGNFDLAHDVATSPGLVAAELASHFTRVVASDSNTSHLEVARGRLKESGVQDSVEVIECAAEKLEQIAEPASVDFVAAAECLPLLDAETSLQSFTSILKPRGTLAIWFYGRPAFAEPEYYAACQPILDRILDVLFAQLIKGGGPAHQRGWKRATDRMTGWLDDVALTQDLWCDVERYKWNSDLPMPFYGSDACDFKIETKSAIHAEEKIIEQEDRAWWASEWDLEGVRRFVLANLPTFEAKMEKENVLSQVYEELGEKMGGDGAVRKITWPVVLILGSKK